MSAHGPAAIEQSRYQLEVTAVQEECEAPAGPFTQVSVVGASPSTNSAVMSALEVDDAGWPHLSVLVADHQTAGRGRGERGWVTPAGVALTASIVLRPQGVARSAYGWVPLITGLAVVRALGEVGVAAGLKWPNDVVIDEPTAPALPGWGTWRKVAGILCESVRDVVVAGIGLNVSQRPEEMPVEHAGSLLVAESTTLDRPTLLSGIGRHLAALMREWQEDVGVVPVSRQVADACVTLAREVAVDVPGAAAPVVGRAAALGEDGSLQVETPSGLVNVVAGDVRVRSV